MLWCMAIRMKEWGMLAYPRQAVQLTLNSLNDWERTGRDMGQGAQQMGRGLGELASTIARVTQTGQLADAEAMLQEIGSEATEELLEQPVRDWNYSWQQAYGPRMQQLASQYSGEVREKVLQMGAAYGRRFSLEGRRQFELKRSHQSRSRWQKQVDSAVMQGDEEAACQWMEQGREVFVPEAEMPQQLEEVRNRSLQAAWQQRLQQDPYAALTSWQSAEARRPADAGVLQRLEGEMENTRQELYHSLASQLASAVEQGQEPDPTVLERAAAAGVLPREQLAGRNQEVAPLSLDRTCDWLRRIDEREAGDDSQLVLSIALAPLPREQRRLLLQRVKTTAALPPQQRTAVSRTLWNWYREGRFGCPGDAESMLHLGRLQEEALHRMTTASREETDKWLERLSKTADAWLCFDEQ